MDRLLPVKSAPKIDFDDMREDADKTSTRSYINYSEQNFNYFFLISTTLLQITTVVIQITKGTVRIIKVRLKKSPRKKRT